MIQEQQQPAPRTQDPCDFIESGPEIVDMLKHKTHHGGIERRIINRNRVGCSHLILGSTAAPACLFDLGSGGVDTHHLSTKLGHGGPRYLPFTGSNVDYRSTPGQMM